MYGQHLLQTFDPMLQNRGKIYCSPALSYLSASKTPPSQNYRDSAQQSSIAHLGRRLLQSNVGEGHACTNPAA
jgi:hypothetical protein